MEGALMRVGQVVEYQTGLGEWGTGSVVDFNEELDLLTVVDDEDGSTWHGPADRATVIQG